MSTKTHSTAQQKAPDGPFDAFCDILIDLDGTVVNLGDDFYLELLMRDPNCIILDDDEYNLFKRFSSSAEDVQAVLDLPGFFRHLKPIPGAQEAIAEMVAEGWSIRFCSTPTDTNPTCREDKKESVREHFGDELAESLILTHDKTEWVAPGLIDDHPNLPGAFIPRWKRVIADQAYNRHIVDVPRLAADWSNWREVLDEVFERVMV